MPHCALELQKHIKGALGKERVVSLQDNAIWPVDCPRVFYHGNETINLAAKVPRITTKSNLPRNHIDCNSQRALKTANFITC